MSRKLFVLTAASTFLGISIFSQPPVTKNTTNNEIVGIIKTNEGNPIPFASVIFKTDKQKTIVTDSLGIFKLNTKTGTTVNVKAVGFKDIAIKINKQDTLFIVMQPEIGMLADVSVAATLGPVTSTKEASIANQQIIANTISDFKGAENLSSGNSYTEHAGLNSSLGNTHNMIGDASTSNLYMGSAIPVFSRKEDTKGSRYLFEKWVKGSIVTSQNTLISNDAYFFNYDKVAKKLLVTQNLSTLIEINKADIKSFSLIDENTNTIEFAKVPVISEQNFQIVLVKPSSKYALYKSVSTKFTKANYVSDGLVERGNNYDEYVDEAIYFVVMPDNTLRTVQLKKKSIKNVFFEELNKVDKFFSEHKDEFINEIFLQDLVYYLNQ